MTPSKATLLDQLDERGRAIGAAKMRQREAELAHAAARRDVDELQEALVNALAGGDDDLAQRLLVERDRLERAVRDAGDQLEAAQLAAARAEGARQEFARRELAGLLAEHARDALAASAAVTAALDQLQAAHAQWREAESTTAHLLRIGGRPQDRTPPFPSDLADLVRRIARANASVPAPMPRVPV